MLNISKPLSASQARNYHTKEFTAAEQNYWKQGDTIQGEWHGKLAADFGLSGAVGAEEFAHLSEGQHPESGKQLVLHRVVHEYKNADGKMVSPVEHRAGWDATFSAPKSISLTALVGGDDHVREAHREAVNVALTELERYTQARIGGNNPAETTGKFAAAKFEHDTARPVDGYAAPQLHTHVVIFNMTERDNEKMRALQPHSLLKASSLLPLSTNPISCTSFAISATK
jgi:conjugative relaxase-like TrwC/TraI family protein